MTQVRPCPICQQVLTLGSKEASDHLKKWHPLFLPRDMNIYDYFLKFVPRYEEHMIRVLQGDESLDPLYEPHIVRTARDHTRHAVLFEPSNVKKIMASTTISAGKAPPSDNTWATKKKRRP